MSDKDYNPDDNSIDTQPRKVSANNAAAAVLAYRATDGSNQQPGTDPASGDHAAVTPAASPPAPAGQ